MQPSVRSAVYGFAVSVGAVLLALGVTIPGGLPLWLDLVSASLTLGSSLLAWLHRPTKQSA